MASVGATTGPRDASPVRSRTPEATVAEPACEVVPVEQALAAVRHPPPVILLPCGMSAALAVEHLECILAHELVHVRRGHFAINLAQRALECVFVWNPFALWISRRLRDEREALCDAAVAGPNFGAPAASSAAAADGTPSCRC